MCIRDRLDRVANRVRTCPERVSAVYISVRGCATVYDSLPVSYTHLSCETARAKGFYDMRKVGKVPTYNKPLALSLIHILYACDVFGRGAALVTGIA